MASSCGEATAGSHPRHSGGSRSKCQRRRERASATTIPRNSNICRAEITIHSVVPGVITSPFAFALEKSEERQAVMVRHIERGFSGVIHLFALYYFASSVPSTYFIHRLYPHLHILLLSTDCVVSLACATQNGFDCFARILNSIQMIQGSAWNATPR